MSRRARGALAFGVVVVAAMVIFGRPLLRGEVFTFRDHADYFQPLRLYTVQHLRAARLPLWNPYNASGEPWMANPQTAVFYPPATLFLVLPFATAYVAYLLLHALILGTGAFRLFSRRASTAAALVGAVALMSSGPVLSLLDVSNNYTTFAWLPFIVWRAGEDRERGGWRVSAVLLAMAFLAAEPFLAAVAALLYVIIVRRWRQVAAVGTVAAGLTAVQLLPFLEMVRGSDRLGGFKRADVLRASMPLGDWLYLILPPRLAHPSQSFIFVVYVGMFVAALAIAGIVALVLRREWLPLAGWCALLVVTACVATGPSLLARLPLTIFRYPARVLPFAAFAIAALAVAGWDRWRRGSVVVDAILIAAILVDLVVAARPLLASAPFVRSRVPYDRAIGRDSKILQVYSDVSLSGGSREAWVSGYLNLLDLRFEALTAAPATSERYMKLYRTALRSLDIAREMGIGWVLTANRLPPPFVAVARADDVVAYRMPHALPMAYVRGTDGTVVPARSLALDASHASVRVVSERGGTLVLTQNDMPGWSVTVDGKPAESTRVLGTFRAVNVQAGVHEIVWTYCPRSLLIGGVTTLATMVALFVSAMLLWRSQSHLSSVARTKNWSVSE